MVHLLIDTDLAGDVDDAIAIAVAGILDKGREIKLEAVTHCLQHEDCARIVQIVNDYYGIDVPIGYASSSKLKYEEYSRRFLRKIVSEDGGEARRFYDAAELIKSKLRAAAEQSLTLVFIGQLNNLAELINDPEAKELLYKKAKEIVIMGGNFADYGLYFEFGNQKWTGECNIISDGESARTVFGESELPIAMVDFNQGLNVLFEPEKSGLCEDNILCRIFAAARFRSRPMWDVVTAIYAARNKPEWFTVSGEGQVLLDERCKTVFRAGGGKHRLVTLTEREKMTDYIYRILKEEESSAIEQEKMAAQ